MRMVDVSIAGAVQRDREDDQEERGQGSAVDDEIFWGRGGSSISAT